MISVVICTYNRATLLASALQTACQQTLLADQFEVIVVDNNSTDGTAQLVAGVGQRYANIRYLNEPCQGLANARNCGWQAAQGDYIAYIDDDCELPPAWLQRAQTIIAARAPGAMIGPYYAIHRAPTPLWWRSEFDHFYSREYAPQAGDLSLNAVGAIGGVSLFIRRDLLQQIGGFDPMLGMRGRQLGYGEDTDIGRKIYRLARQAIYYDPQLYVYHLIRTEKLVLRRLIYELFTRGRFSHRIFSDPTLPKRPVRAWLRGGKLTIKLLWIMGKAFLRNRQQDPYLEQYLYGHVDFRTTLQQLGQSYERLLG